MFDKYVIGTQKELKPVRYTHQINVGKTMAKWVFIFKLFISFKKCTEKWVPFKEAFDTNTKVLNGQCNKTIFKILIQPKNYISRM